MVRGPERQREARLVERCCNCGEPIRPQPGEILRLGPITLNTETQEVRVWGERRPVWRGAQVALLAAFMRSPDRAFKKYHLENIADALDAESNTLGTHLCRLRKAIGDVLEVRYAEGVGWEVRLTA